MTWELDNFLVLAILFGSLVLFITERFRVDVVAMMVLAALLLTGLVTVEQAFAGLSSPAVITVFAVFILSGALYKSGVADALARTVLSLAGTSEVRLLVLLMLTAGIMSAFMNNIGAVAIMLPAVISVARSSNISQSKLLLPLAFAALMGGNMTLIGTPPNILASGILGATEGLEPFTFFDFLPMGVIILTTGILYMVLIGRHLLPERRPVSAPSEVGQLRSYLTEVNVTDNSSLVGKSLPEAELGKRHNLNIIQIQRNGDDPLFPSPDQHFRAGDTLLLEGQRDDIVTTCDLYNLILVPSSSEEDLEQGLTIGSAKLAEITLAPRSDLVGLSLQQIGFRNRYDLSVLAIRHMGESLVSRLADVPLQFGDSLLVQGEQAKIDLLSTDDNFMVLDSPPPDIRRLGKGRLAIVILVVTLVVATVGWMDPASALFIGALVMVLAGVVRIDEAYESIEWRAIFLIAWILPLGIALETTGTATLIADFIVGLVGDAGPLAVLIAVFILTALLTEVISNAAATVLVVPIAIDTAASLGASPYTFVMAVVIAASTSFLTPIGHQVNVLIYGPGGYKFTDYTRVGIGLNLLMLLLAATVLPIIWPMFP